ncbi:MAG: TonB family protein [Bacteroidetes bacterium]|nr:TonB family protein [Bacteroidota bacterium]
MNRPTTILLIFLLSLPLVTNGRTYLDDENGRISGKVVNKTSESGLSGVTIILFEDGAVKFSTRTDQNGNFSFVNIPAGAYLITAKKNSYSDFAKTIRVNPKFTLKLKLGMESLEQPSRPVLTAVSAPKSEPMSKSAERRQADATQAPGAASGTQASPETATASATPGTAKEDAAEEGEIFIDETDVVEMVENPDQQPEPVGGIGAIIKAIVYPPMAIQRKLEGTVLINVTVNQYGDPTQCVVIRSVDPTLDEAAVETIYRSKFIPASHRGKAVVSSVAIPVKFKL